MKQGLTDKQLEALCFMKDFLRENDQLPPIRAISKHLGYSSRHAMYIQKALEEKGWIERNSAGKFRFAREAA